VRKASSNEHPAASMKILAIGGCGAMGKAATRALIEMPVFDEVVIGDIDLKAAQSFAEKLSSPKIRTRQVDVSDASSLAKAVEGIDIVANLTLYEFNLPIMRACLQSHSHYLDLGGLYHVTNQQLKLHRDFQSINRLALLGMGASPGMTNIAAALGARQLDEVREIHIRTGTIGGGKGFSYSAKTVLDECTMNAMLFTNGEMQEMPPLSGREKYRLPEPVGEVEGFYSIHSELATLPYQYPGIREVSFRVAFSPRLVQMIDSLIAMQLTSTEKFNLRGLQISPREFLDSHLMRLPKSEELTEQKAFRVEVIGIKDKKPAQFNYEIVVPSHQEWGLKAGSYWTGVPAVVAAEQIVLGSYKTPGTFAPEAVFDAVAMCNELAKWGLKIKEHRMYR
jgi:saccharopine dehydrogenase (NAD+, L-lysine-forming)